MNTAVEHIPASAPLQGVARAEELSSPEPELAALNASASAHVLLRVLLRCVHDDPDVSEAIGADRGLKRALQWLWSEFGRYYGVAPPFTKLYEMRLLLESFTPSAEWCAPVE